MKVPNLDPSLFPNRDLAEAWAEQVEIVRAIPEPTPMRDLAYGEIVAYKDEAVKVVMTKGNDVFVMTANGRVVKARRQDVTDL